MTDSLKWTDIMIAVTTAGQFIVAVVAAYVVWREYSGHKRERRVTLAAGLIAKLTDDELISFAAVSLDWGSGLIVAPSGWRHLFPQENNLVYSDKIVEDALIPTITDTTRSSPLGLLYRHTFVRLFDHLEIVMMYCQKDALLIDELGGLGSVANRLMKPLYVQRELDPENRPLYKIAITKWYSSDLLKLIERLARRFPDKVELSPESQSTGVEGPSSI
jgi:hypothetical protein